MHRELPEFDVLLEMAERRPEQLEALRVELIEAIISSAREDCQRRLRGLQFKVDSTRRAARTPMAACIRISQLMHESLTQLREALTEPEEALSRRASTPAATRRSAPTVSADEAFGSNVVSMIGYRSRRSRPAIQEQA